MWASIIFKLDDAQVRGAPASRSQLALGRRWTGGARRSGRAAVAGIGPRAEVTVRERDAARTRGRDRPYGQRAAASGRRCSCRSDKRAVAEVGEAVERRVARLEQTLERQLEAQVVQAQQQLSQMAAEVERQAEQAFGRQQAAIEAALRGVEASRVAAAQRQRSVLSTTVVDIKEAAASELRAHGARLRRVEQGAAAALERQRSELQAAVEAQKLECSTLQQRLIAATESEHRRNSQL
eukprot:SAG11_NODE_3648_length_2314_cov_1.573363_3_plen_237_part_01